MFVLEYDQHEWIGRKALECSSERGTPAATAPHPEVNARRLVAERDHGLLQAELAIQLQRVGVDTEGVAGHARVSGAVDDAHADPEGRQPQGQH